MNSKYERIIYHIDAASKQALETQGIDSIVQSNWQLAIDIYNSLSNADKKEFREMYPKYANRVKVDEETEEELKTVSENPAEDIALLMFDLPYAKPIDARVIGRAVHATHERAKKIKSQYDDFSDGVKWGRYTIYYIGKGTIGNEYYIIKDNRMNKWFMANKENFSYRVYVHEVPMRFAENVSAEGVLSGLKNVAKKVGSAAFKAGKWAGEKTIEYGTKAGKWAAKKTVAGGKYVAKKGVELGKKAGAKTVELGKKGLSSAKASIHRATAPAANGGNPYYESEVPIATYAPSEEVAERRFEEFSKRAGSRQVEVGEPRLVMCFGDDCETENLITASENVTPEESIMHRELLSDMLDELRTKEEDLKSLIVESEDELENEIDTLRRETIERRIEDLHDELREVRQSLSKTRSRPTYVMPSMTNPIFTGINPVITMKDIAEVSAAKFGAGDYGV